jgi:hypothetical protein
VTSALGTTVTVAVAVAVLVADALGDADPLALALDVVSGVGVTDGDAHAVTRMRRTSGTDQGRVAERMAAISSGGTTGRSC